MYVGLKQPRGDGERCVTPARAAAKETNPKQATPIFDLPKEVDPQASIAVRAVKNNVQLTTG